MSILNFGSACLRLQAGNYRLITRWSADDLLYLSASLISVEQNFNILEKEYEEIGLSFNTSKHKIFLFSRNNPVQLKIQLRTQVVLPFEYVALLSLPICNTIQSAQGLTVKHIEKKF